MPSKSTLLTLSLAMIACEAFVPGLPAIVSRSSSRTALGVTLNGDATSSSSTAADLAARTRKDFPILNDRKVGEKMIPLVYLDSAATSQKPQQVIDQITHYYHRLNANVHRGAHTLSREATAAYEDAREKVRAFIQAPSREEIVFTSGATESINLIVQTYGRENLQAGDEVILTVVEHHANLVPWQMLAKEKGFTIKYAKISPATGALDIEHFASLLSPKTKMVGFQHVSNVLAAINPVKEMVALVRTASPDAKIVLDACQSVPHMPVNVQDLGVDFLVASGHKMCAPTGIGFLWGKLDLLNSMPPYQGGGEMIDEVTLEGSTFQPSPARFEAGTPAIAQAVGLGAAIDYLNEIGMDKIEAYEMELGQYLYNRLSEVPGITILGPTSKRVGLAAFYHESIHPSDLSTFLDMDGVAIRAGHHCCQPLHKELGFSHSARASLAFYNTKE